jgi:hypothetical protein
LRGAHIWKYEGCCGGSIVLTVENGVGIPAASEPFSSWDLTGLKDVDGFGQMPGFPWAAAEFAQDTPGFQLGVGAFAGRP